MVYITGDIHGAPGKIKSFCHKKKLSSNDIIVILGDVGCNYYMNERDAVVKEMLSSIGPTVLCIHGNHEARPSGIDTYREKTWHGGIVWVEDAYPNLLFAKDGEIFDLEGKRAIVLGGAYSVDKHYRLSRGWNWWDDEQPSDEIKSYAEKQLAKRQVDIVLSHTCPFKYEPKEMFLTDIDQSTVDASTEKWLDKIEENINYNVWYCGHWHVDKRIDRMHFLYNKFEIL